MSMMEKGIEVARSNLHDNPHVEGEVGMDREIYMGGVRLASEPEYGLEECR